MREFWRQVWLRGRLAFGVAAFWISQQIIGWFAGKVGDTVAAKPGVKRMAGLTVLWLDRHPEAYVIAALLCLMCWIMWRAHREIMASPTPAVVASSSVGSIAPVVEPIAERIVLDIDAAVLIGIKNSTQTIAEKQRLWKPYVGKWIRVSGPVADVSETKMFLVNYTTPIMHQYELVLKFDAPWSDRFSIIPKGSNVTVLGRIEDFMAALVVISRCELISDTTTQSRRHEEVARLTTQAPDFSEIISTFDARVCNVVERNGGYTPSGIQR